MKMVKVLIPNIKGRAIIQDGQGNLFIINSLGYFTGQEMQYDMSKAIPMPSLLFAITVLQEDNFEGTIEFIKKNW